MEYQPKLQATISSKGQVTIPKLIRQILGVNYGSKVNFVLAENGKVELVTAEKFQSEQEVREQLADYYIKYGSAELAEEDKFLESFAGDWE